MIKQLSSKFSLKLHSYITHLDTFGIVYSPRFFGKPKIKSIYGALLTIILFILGIIKIIQLIDRVRSRADFNVIMEKKINSDRYIPLSNVTLFFCI